MNTNNKHMLELDSVSKFYYNKGMVSSGLNKISLKFDIGEFVAITGESGSGKSTLLNVISGLDTYEEGEMYINGKETSHYVEKDYEIYRRKYIGNIFQAFNLVNSYTVYQNIELVLLLNGEKKKDIKPRILSLIEKVGLTKYKNRKVSKLSGGQKQRVAIARALAINSPIILADEPTGNLDKKSSENIIELLHELSSDKLVIIVTHNYEQVEKYVTRKITMHDGKVLDDKKITSFDKKEATEINVKNITFLNKLKLGFRNAFNIPVKFVLIGIVYLFIVFSLYFVYTLFSLLSYEESLGYSPYFNNASDDRIVIKKKDKTSFTEEDYNNITKLSNISRIEKNDFLIDNSMSIWSTEYSFYGYLHDISSISKVDLGRMPQKDNEIVVSISKDDNYYINHYEEIIKEKMTLNYIENNTYTIVGFVYNENDNNYTNDIYVSKNLLKKITNSMMTNYTKIYSYQNNTKVQVWYSVLPNKHVKEGYTLLPEELSYYCETGICTNKDRLKLSIENLFYTDNASLKIETYNSDNIKTKLGISKYEQPIIYISQIDYDNLFNKGFYQSSVFIKDKKLVNETINELNKLDLETLYTKELMIEEDLTVTKILSIVKLCVMIGLVVVLFYISYFIIKIILKSRNVYYSTLRILGSSFKCTKDLLNIELIVISHCAYIVFVVFQLLISNNVIHSEGLLELSEYAGVVEYVVLYIILFLMTLLTTSRFSRKLFKGSMMSVYREEV